MELKKRTELQPRQLARWGDDLWSWFDNMLDTTRGMLSLPTLDVEETEDKIIVRAEVPGVDAKDIDIQLRNNVLTIRGEKKEESEKKGKEFHRRERRYGAFYREVSLPAGVDPSQVQATCRDGVLTITMAKTEGEKPKRIEVKGS